MNEERCIGEGLEGFCGRWCPGQRLGLVLEQTGKWIGDGDVFPDEPPVEVSKSQKVLEFFDGGR